MGKPKKKGAYEHFCLLIFAQSKWHEKERESIVKLLREKHDMKSDNPYHFYLKLTRRDEKPAYSDCNLCGPIYEMFEEILSQNDGILYQGHHYLVPEDDMENMKELVNLILSHEVVKKIYILYLDSLSDFDRNLINRWEMKELKTIVKIVKSNSRDFEKLIDGNQFQNRIIYEIIKTRQY